MAKGFLRRLAQRSYADHRPEQWQASAIVHGLRDIGARIVFSPDEILISGASGVHDSMLVTRRRQPRLSEERMFRLNAVAAYIFDLPLVARPDSRPAKGSRGWTRAYFETLAHTSDACAELYHQYEHEHWALPDEMGWFSLSLPSSDPQWRAMLSYWSALISPAVPARVINFYRAIEALLPTRVAQEQLLASLPTAQIRRVWGEPWKPDARRFDRMIVLRRRALRRFNALLALHGAVAAVREQLWRHRRGKAAHADQATAEYDQFGTLIEQREDSELLHYVARVALEQNWP
ncbi:MAG: hypothetical protein HOW73_00760 [Polyangiaceae bacterium]|nr:hypothetical protein [Polyangiaceae bacterium]